MLAVTAALALAGCAHSSTPIHPDDGLGDQSAVPVEFRPACGQMNVVVTVKTVPVTVKHVDCDLSRAVIQYGLAQASVPEPGKTQSTTVDTFAATTEPTHVVVVVDAMTLDVTVTG